MTSTAAEAARTTYAAEVCDYVLVAKSDESGPPFFGGAMSFPQRIRDLPAYEGAFDARQLHAENCEVLFASYPAGMEIEPHQHSSENHGVVTKGELIMIIDDVTHRFGPGDWYFLPAEQEHAASFAVDTSLIEFWFKP